MNHVEFASPPTVGAVLGADGPAEATLRPLVGRERRRICVDVGMRTAEWSPLLRTFVLIMACATRSAGGLKGGRKVLRRADDAARGRCTSST